MATSSRGLRVYWVRCVLLYVIVIHNDIHRPLPHIYAAYGRNIRGLATLIRLRISLQIPVLAEAVFFSGNINHDSVCQVTELYLSTKSFLWLVRYASRTRTRRTRKTERLGDNWNFLKYTHNASQSGPSLYTQYGIFQFVDF